MAVGGTPGLPAKVRGSTRTAVALLQAGEYARAAETLCDVQDACDPGAEAVLVATLKAAHRICLACDQVQQEAEQHKQGYQDAIQRLAALQQQLCAILDLVDPCATGEELEEPRPALSSPAVAHERSGLEPLVPAEHGGLWRRVLALLGKKGSPQAPGGGGDSPPRVGQGAPAVDIARRELAREGSELPQIPLSVPDRTPEPAPAKPSSEAECDVVQAAPTVVPGADGKPVLRIYSLGLFRVYVNGQLVERWDGRKCKSVLKYLVVHRDQPIHREILMDLYWRDAAPDAARRNLYQAIYHLRHALQIDDCDWAFIVSQDGCYSFHPDVEIWVDSEAFEAHYQAGQRLEREGRMDQAVQEYEAADNLYGGEFLAEDRYLDWPVVQRESLKHAHLAILHKVSQYYYDRAQFSTCIAFCQKILAEDRCREDAHRRLMRCYVRQGQRHLALNQYRLCTRILKEELDVLPMPATSQLCRQIQEGEVQFVDGAELSGK